MNMRRQNKLRKNPFIRLFQMIYRSLKVIFRPKSKRLAIAALHEQRLLDARRVQEEINAQRELESRRALDAIALAQELDDRAKEQFLTVGELLRRVKWQTVKEPAGQFATATLAHDFSLN